MGNKANGFKPFLHKHNLAMDSDVLQAIHVIRYMRRVFHSSVAQNSKDTEQQMKREYSKVDILNQTILPYNTLNSVTSGKNRIVKSMKVVVRPW